MAVLKLGTRGSDLARWQAAHVASLIRQARPEIDVDVVVISTIGDRVLDSPLSKIGGNGLFTKEIEDALTDRRIDFAVHSLKDLPTALPPGLALAAVLSRNDPADAWISASGKGLDSVPSGAKIGTSSLRRQAQLLHKRRDLEIVTLRGNVPTRLGKALRGELDAVVLARAGLERLGLIDHVTEILPTDLILPAPGQGALGVETRERDGETLALFASLEDPTTRAAATAERAFLHALGGGCQVPIGALARPLESEAGMLELEGMVAEPDGSVLLRGAVRGSQSDAAQIGGRLASDLLSRGAGDILSRLGVRGDGGGGDGMKPPAGPRKARRVEAIPQPSTSSPARGRTGEGRATVVTGDARPASEGARGPVTGRGAKQDRILDAAAGLFGEREPSAVTMEEVAAMAGVAKGTLYNYFSSKDDLYASIITVRMTELLDTLKRSFDHGRDARERLKTFVAEEMSFLLRYPGFFRMLRKEEARPAGDLTDEVRSLRVLLRETLRCVLDRGMEQGTVRAVSPGWATDLILGTVEGAALRCIEDGVTPVREAEEAEALFDFLWRSISVTNGLEAGGATLAGVLVIVTREEGPGGELSLAIERLGGTPVRLPLIRTEPPLDPLPLRSAAGAPAGYDWILFTSARGVEAFWEVWKESGSPPFPSTRVGAIGSATASGLRECFGRVDLIAERSSGAGLAATIARTGIAGKRILLPRAEHGRPELPHHLREAGALVDEVAAYRTAAEPQGGEPTLERMRDAWRVVWTFASPSAVSGFSERFGEAFLTERTGGTRIVTIGPTTSAALRAIGVEPDGEALDPSFQGLAVTAARVARAPGR